MNVFELLDDGVVVQSFPLGQPTVDEEGVFWFPSVGGHATFDRANGARLRIGETILEMPEVVVNGENIALIDSPIFGAGGWIEFPDIRIRIMRMA